MTAPKVTIRDRGFKKILKSLHRATDRVVVAVGVLGEDASNTYPDGTTVGQVAVWNHFGTETIPARPFISGPIESQKSEIEALQARLAKGIYEGKLDTEKALEFVGADLQKRIQKAITEGIPPPNAPSTVAAKGSSGTLRDTGQLLQSIHYEVRKQ